MENKRDNKIKFWEAFWPQLQQASKDAENHIDKKVYGISAGGIGIEIASLQFLNNISFKLFAILSGALFATTLVLNLYSHVRSLKSQEKEGDEIQKDAPLDADLR